MFEVISQLQFVHRPPSKLSIKGTSIAIAINCSATVAPGLAVHTHWSINRNNKKESGCVKSLSVFSNGTLVIPDAERCGIGVYNCSAHHDGESISTSMQVVSSRGTHTTSHTHINNNYYL